MDANSNVAEAWHPTRVSLEQCHRPVVSASLRQTAIRRGGRRHGTQRWRLWSNAAGLVAAPEDWPWSSAAAHVSGKPDLLAQSAWLAEQTVGWICSWREFLLQPDPNHDDFARKLRRHESTGRPLGDKAFIQKLESLLGRPLLPEKRGPKPKLKDETPTLLDDN